MQYKLTKYETETTILFNDDEKLATVYTCNKALKRKLKLYCEQYPDYVKITREDYYSVTVKLPKKLIGIKKPRAIKSA